MATVAKSRQGKNGRDPEQRRRGLLAFERNRNLQAATDSRRGGGKLAGFSIRFYFVKEI